MAVLSPQRYSWSRYRDMEISSFAFITRAVARGWKILTWGGDVKADFLYMYHPNTEKVISVFETRQICVTQNVTRSELNDWVDIGIAS